MYVREKLVPIRCWYQNIYNACKLEGIWFLLVTAIIFASFFCIFLILWSASGWFYPAYSDYAPLTSHTPHQYLNQFSCRYFLYLQICKCTKISWSFSYIFDKYQHWYYTYIHPLNYLGPFIYFRYI